MAPSQPIIVFLRQDLRLADNPALTYACETGAEIILTYILDDYTPKKWKIGGAQRWWLHYSLKSLQNELAEKECKLILRSGDTLTTLKTLVQESNAQGIYYNRCYEPYWIEFENQLNRHFGDLQIHSYNGTLLIEPWKVSTQQGKPYKVFTKFWHTASKLLDVPSPFKKPNIKPYSKKLTSETLESWNLLPTHPNWASEFSDMWQPGEEGAHKKLTQFTKSVLDHYSDGRNIPSTVGTSLLSPHLHFGEISSKQIFHFLINEKNLSHKEVEGFIRELGWREFTHYSLVNFPKLPEQSFQENFTKFPWKNDSPALHAWQKGLVGYPIVDAGMRQLWHMGWMHNRVRMIVASFLTKDLLIPWQKGEEWFWDTLVDADLANNAFNWQWAAGCGMDAAPFFRIFNPTLQGEKFDPNGEYIKKWIPELAKLPVKYIHQPWEAPTEILQKCGIELGKTYPYPIVDHKVARDEALKHFKSIKNV